jgi:hypothetical protein
MRHRTLLLLIVCLAWAGCASAPVEEAPGPPALPFHVGVLPLESVELRASSAPPDGDVTDMRLDLDASGVAEALTSELEQRAFARVTQLGPGGDPVALGRAERADLLLEVSVRYGPAIWRERIASSTWHFFLFAIGGPFVINQRDFRYLADAELEATLYDLSAIDGERVRLGDARARVLLSEARFDGEPLSYNERREGSPGWWKCLFVPSGLLAKQSPALEQRLALDIPKSLARDLADDLVRERGLLLDRGPLAGFVLDADETRFEQEADGALRVRGWVTLPRGSRFDSMRRLRVWVGEALVEASFGAPEPSPEGLRVPFTTRVPNAGRYVTLELEAGSRDPLRRTYCFDLDRLAD